MSRISNSEVSEGQIIELSEDELEQLSGGLVNVSFTFLMTEDSREVAAQELFGDGYSGFAIAGQRQRSFFGLQFSGTFQSMRHVNSFLSRLSGVFGGR